MLTETAKLAIDLELPEEAWVEDYEEFGPLFRLIFWTGYERGRSDRDRLLEREVKAACVSTV